MCTATHLGHGQRSKLAKSGAILGLAGAVGLLQAAAHPLLGFTIAGKKVNKQTSKNWAEGTRELPLCGPKPLVLPPWGVR